MDDILKIVIVEDEPVSTAYLKKLIKDTGIQHHIVNELDSVSDSMLYFGSKPDYDLVFMDINLGDGICFEILNAKVIDKPIIFCTSFDNYAIHAFKYNSIDYLLKPANIEDVQKALEKFKAMNRNNESMYLDRMDQMLESFRKPHYKQRFLVKKEGHLELIETKDVVGFYSEIGQTFLVNENGESFLVDYTMEHLEELVDPTTFFRINRKAMININYIKTVEDYINNRLLVQMKIDIKLELIVSRNRVKDFKFWLKS